MKSEWKKQNENQMKAIRNVIEMSNEKKKMA
jgi:hypothetical protein